MSMISRLRSLPWACAVIAVFASARTKPTLAADGTTTLAVRYSASESPAKVVRTELKVFAPTASSRHGYSLAQAEPIKPGRGSGGDRPVAQELPASGQQPEEEFLSWKPIGDVTATATIKTAGVVDTENA